MSEYKRLTKRVNGIAAKIKTSTSDYVGTIYEEEQVLQQEIIERLAELEDKLEEGTLVELPCKVGDTVYSVDFIFSDGYEFDKKGHEKAVHSSGWKIIKTEVTEKNIYRICDMYVSGKIFETREAAEARLKELEEKE